MTEQLGVFIEAARRRDEALDHVLLAGPPGLGKTSLAHIIAAELDAPLVQTAGPALERKADIAAFLTALEPGSVFFIDEVHRLGRAVEETLYPADGGPAAAGRAGAGRGGPHRHARPAAVHADRRHHPHGAADDAAARPLRGLPPPGALRGRRPAPDRAALGGHSRHRGDRGRGRGRSPRARAARRGSPTGCCAGSATSRRSAGPGRSTTPLPPRLWRCWRWTAPASTATTAGC